MELRRVSEREEPEFLRVLCTVFDLDHSRARGIFFKEPLHDSRQNWAVIDGHDILSILTLTPLEFGWGRTFGISGVATLEENRGQGLARTLLEKAMQTARAEAIGGFMLFAHQTQLYGDLGFRPVDRVVRAGLVTGESPGLGQVLTAAQVEPIYRQWSEAAPDRLRREPARWEFWRWSLRTLTAVGGGYVGEESGMVREAVLVEPTHSLPVPAEASWYGLASLTANLGIPVVGAVEEMYVMGLDLPGQPQMFMSDQF